MTIYDAIEKAKQYSDLYKMDVYVLCDEKKEYYTSIFINLQIYLTNNRFSDKKIYFISYHNTIV